MTDITEFDYPSPGPYRGWAVSLLGELQRRKVFKVGAAYLVVAWLTVQVVSIAFPAFEAPAWALRVFILLALLGFPVAMMMAWAFVSTLEGLKRDTSPLGNKRMAGIAALFIVLALAWYFFGVPALRPGEEAASAGSAAPTAAAASAAPAIPDRSIAVLAFVNMSADPENEFFSDGIAEEILNALAKLEGLKVAGRTSAFHFKGRNEDLRTIGQTLGVAHVLEGSVRKQGERVRITAQLIRVDDGFHLWSETYDGDLGDVFALQERIARAVTEQLKVMLEAGSPLVLAGTHDPDAYALYLRASDALHRRDYAAMGQALGWLQRAIELDPGFARAHARLGLLHTLGQPRFGADRDAAEGWAKAAIALEPSLAESYHVLGSVARHQRRYAEARPWYERALELEPNDASANLYFAQWLIVTGYTREGIARLERTLSIDPMLPNALHWRAWQHLLAGEIDDAQRLAERSDALGLSFAVFTRAEVAAARGDLAQARALTLTALLGSGHQGLCLQDPPPALARLVQGIFGGNAAEQEAALAVVDECLASGVERTPIWVINTLLRLGQPERALTVLLERGPTADDAGLSFSLWGPRGRELRRLPRFPQLARHLGLAEAWDRYGEPDLCRKAENGDYVCG